MKFQSYTATPGLDRYAKHERFAKWQAAHKQLLREDAAYRKRFNSYIFSVIFLSCILLPFYGVYFGFRIFGLMANLAIIFTVTAAVIYLAVRQMLYMNKQIGRHLQSTSQA